MVLTPGFHRPPPLVALALLALTCLLPAEHNMVSAWDGGMIFCFSNCSYPHGGTCNPTGHCECNPGRTGVDCAEEPDFNTNQKQPDGGGGGCSVGLW